MRVFPVLYMELVLEIEIPERSTTFSLFAKVNTIKDFLCVFMRFFSVSLI